MSFRLPHPSMSPPSVWYISLCPNTSMYCTLASSTLRNPSDERTVISGTLFECMTAAALFIMVANP